MKKAIIKEHVEEKSSVQCDVSVKQHCTNLIEVLTGYSCSFCTTCFLKPQELKKHILETHDTKDIEKNISGKQIYTVKLDVTALKCALCNENLLSLEEFILHLKNVHNRAVLKNFKDLLIPFTIEDYCDKTMDTRNDQGEPDNAETEKYMHSMNREVLLSTNLPSDNSTGSIENDEISIFSDGKSDIKNHYFCDNCGMDFITSDALKFHQQSHTEVKTNGSNKYLCIDCDRNFDEENDWKMHMKVDHGYSSKKGKRKAGSQDLKQQTKFDTPNSKEGRSEVAIKIRSNIFEVLSNSNATAIRNCIDKGYTCCFCNKYFQNPSDLKKHNLERHDKSTLTKGLKAKHILDSALKIDVTGLYCILCETSIPMLDDLIRHLAELHNRPFHYDVENLMVPLKFDSNLLICVFCEQNFVKLKLLMSHMNIHYRNYVCKDCNRGFITRQIYRSHVRTHAFGNFKCDFCDKVMNTKAKKLRHERILHGRYKNFDESASKYVNKCSFCNEVFNGYHKKEKHLVEVHGVRLPTLECKACEQVFTNRKSYTIHYNRDHLMERKHECRYCEKNFFSSSTLKQHELKHSGLKQYQCDICLKFYVRKHTLREHLRIHADDRKHVCRYCGQSFVQKCSWVGHMRAKHGIVEEGRCALPPT